MTPSVPCRIRLAVALTSVAISAAAAAPAQAGEYTLVQCDPAHRGYGEARFDRTDGAYYGHGRHCGDRRNDYALKIGNIAAAPTGASGRIAWLAPDGTSVVGVRAQARLRADGGHRARLSFLDSRGEQAGRIATGRDEPGGFETHRKRLDGAGRAGFAAHLICIDDRSCGRSDQARAWVRSVRLTLLDPVSPTVSASGALLGGGWQRGHRALGVSVADRGAGLRHLDVAVGGRRIEPSRSFGCSLLAGGQARAARPCPAHQTSEATLDTTAAPFVNGPNRLTICARDFGEPANQRCIARTVAVDNLAPSAAFDGRNPADPELISAAVSDAHSGLASVRMAYRRVDGGAWKEAPAEATPGGVRARIDSRAEPRGHYLFRVVATDNAGNVTSTTHRRDGTRMVLEFPLLERTVMNSRIHSLGHRVGYGARPRFTGHLKAAGGAPLGDRPVEVVERFEPGSRPMVRTRIVETDASGRFRARLSSGPSRTVEARYAGGGRYLPATAGRRKLAVVGLVRLRLSRKRVPAGGRVGFRGRVGTSGARVPAPGKIVELQVREGGRGRFRTVRDSLHTGARGRVRTSYRFRRFYRRPARFQFRLKVTREAGWPYRAPAHSDPRKLKVLPRR